MSTRIAAFGGVYSNDRALRAMLADAGARGADRIVCLGDLGGFGPHPDRAIEIVRTAAIPALRGNVDDSVGHDRGDCACGYTDPRDNLFAQVSFDYTRARTAPAHKAWLRDLPEQIRLDAAGRRVLLCPGSPASGHQSSWASVCSAAL